MTDVRSDRNGVDVDALHELAATVVHADEPVRLAVTTRHRWEGGAAVTGGGGSVAVLGETVDRSHHTVRTDLPALLGGRDSAPAPTEVLFAAVAGCVVSTLAETAALEGVDIGAVEASVSGGIDVRGTFGVEAVPVGLDGVTVTLAVRADVPDEALEELCRAGVALSPTAASLAAPVHLEVRRLPEVRT